MIGLVTELARQQLAAQEAALKGARYREVEEADGTTRLIPARMGTAPLLAASDPEADEEMDDKAENGAFKAMAPGVSSNPRATLVMQGHGPAVDAMAGHVYRMQRNAQMPTPLADLQTTEPAAYAGPTFAPGTATVQQQNHRTPTGVFPQAHAPGQVPFHVAPNNIGGAR
ncbi:hypothetical protein [Streptomyces olivochromogenes]|uniref:Uncharacterized protein n=1 Tax=Streptomyces olivochromogenes TaxID=1963 RepID=A0A250VF80_STROL|nr:hypothetical protein [Streptomyces olivochromogenes]KUN47440.1 hypothetical protein AQJ27_10920 [Streptomyces olivochromogenes]GAX52858.1 hypothetical protein SO3561_04377 [Streptomyces olivochromogenes]